MHLPNAETLAWLRDAVGDAAIAPMGVGANRLYSVGDLVLRVFHDADRLASDPWYRPENEARVLRLLAETPVPAPELIAVRLDDPEPALLTTRVPGTPEPPADPRYCWAAPPSCSRPFTRWTRPVPGWGSTRPTTTPPWMARARCPRGRRDHTSGSGCSPRWPANPRTRHRA